MEEFILNWLIVITMSIVSMLVATTRTQSPVEIIVVSILTISIYSAANCGVIKMRQAQMQQDIDKLKELIKKEQ